MLRLDRGQHPTGWRYRRILPTGVVCFCCLVAVAVPANAIDCFTPREWQPKLVETPLDSNNNFVDDLIDARSLSETVDVILDLNDCPLSNELDRLTQFGDLNFVSKYVSIVGLREVLVADVITLAQDPLVAFVEEDSEVFVTLNTSNPAIKVGASAAFSPNTIADQYPLLDGTGINIAIVDTGVDDGTHEAFSTERFIGGYNALTETFENPSDEHGHGTHVAGIALGEGVTPPPPGLTRHKGLRVNKGIAPNAGLIDIKVFDASGETRSGVICKGMEAVLDKREEWNIHVVNMSLADCRNSNGTDSFSVLANRLVFEGITVVAAAGNVDSRNCGDDTDGPVQRMPAPGAADDVISVANSNNNESIARGDDTINGGSLRGPRRSDDDLDTDDEQKPDIAAPGTNIGSAQTGTTSGLSDGTGTSMAAPHVAGCAALILQAKNDITPRSVKELLLETADDKGATGWDSAWGHGLVDCFDAIDTLLTTAETDLKFEVYRRKPDTKWWKSPDLFPSDPDVIEGATNTINAVVTNDGPVAVSGFSVSLGIYNFGNSDNDYHICTRVVDTVVEPGATVAVECDYRPSVSGDGTVHACLKAEIVHPFDTDFENNMAQHNIDIEQASSPATFLVEASNPTDQPLIIQLREELAAGTQGWQLLKSDDNFLLGPSDCPKDVVLELDPTGSSPSVIAEVDVEIIGIADDDTEMSLGGVTLLGQLPDCNANGIADSIDIANGDSSDINADGVPDECQTRTVVWNIFGVAQGGEVGAAIRGFSDTCTVSILTIAGQTAETVASNFAQAVNTDACLQGQGIIASVSGNTVVLSGVLLTHRDVTTINTDPGLEHEMPLLTIPTMSKTGMAVMILIITIVGFRFVARKKGGM